MEKSKKLYLFSLGFLLISLIFIFLLIFVKAGEEGEEYVVAEHFFNLGIKASFFYIAYLFGAACLTLTTLSFFKNNYLLKRSSFFIKVCYLILLVIPFFSKIYYEFAHKAFFFQFDILGIGFLSISAVIEYFALRNTAENIHVDRLIDEYRLVINFDYFLLLISGLIIITLSFIIGDFYVFSSTYLPNVPFYFIPLLSLLFYIVNAYKLNYVQSRYFSFLTIVKSRFVYYFIAYVSIIRLGYFAYSDYSFYDGLKVLRMALLLAFIAIVIFNSFLPKIDLSFILSAIIVTLFSFEVVGMVNAIKENENFMFVITYFLLDYIIVIFIALPYYIFTGIDRLFLKGDKI